MSNTSTTATETVCNYTHITKSHGENGLAQYKQLINGTNRLYYMVNLCTFITQNYNYHLCWIRLFSLKKQKVEVQSPMTRSDSRLLNHKVRRLNHSTTSSCLVHLTKYIPKISLGKTC